MIEMHGDYTTKVFLGDCRDESSDVRGVYASSAVIGLLLMLLSLIIDAVFIGICVALFIAVVQILKAHYQTKYCIAELQISNLEVRVRYTEKGVERELVSNLDTASISMRVYSLNRTATWFLRIRAGDVVVRQFQNDQWPRSKIEEVVACFQTAVDFSGRRE